MPSSVRGRFARGHHGQSLVEFALIAPILTILLLGAVDLTRAFYYYIILENATRATARVLIDYPNQYTDTAACASGAREASSFVPLSCPTTLTISPKADTSVSPPQRLPGRKLVTVTAQTTFTPLTFFIQAFTGGTLTIKAQTSMLSWY